ncbi:uncharacterized protein LOC144342273 [Saccoglossus kowalevskii]
MPHSILRECAKIGFTCLCCCFISLGVLIGICAVIFWVISGIYDSDDYGFMGTLMFGASMLTLGLALLVVFACVKCEDRCRRAVSTTTDGDSITASWERNRTRTGTHATTYYERPPTYLHRYSGYCAAMGVEFGSQSSSTDIQGADGGFVNLLEMITDNERVLYCSTARINGTENRRNDTSNYAENQNAMEFRCDSLVNEGTGSMHENGEYPEEGDDVEIPPAYDDAVEGILDERERCLLPHSLEVHIDIDPPSYEDVVASTPV